MVLNWLYRFIQSAHDYRYLNSICKPNHVLTK